MQPQEMPLRKTKVFENATRASPASVGRLGPGSNSEITWLLHRAAQRMRRVTGEHAERHGVQLRDYIVLSALHKSASLTQGQLGKALGLDKTTLMSQLDRLEQAGLIERHSVPGDRRARIPVITKQGEAVHARVARAADRAERAALSQFSTRQVASLRQMLLALIGDSEDPGSCL